jgi:hypothetical protein
MSFPNIANPPLCSPGWLELSACKAFFSANKFHFNQLFKLGINGIVVNFFFKIREILEYSHFTFWSQECKKL